MKHARLLIISRIICIVIAASVISSLSGCVFITDYNGYETYDPEAVFSEMVYERPDTEEFYRQAEIVRRICYNPMKTLSAVNAMNAMTSEYINFLCAYSLADICYALNVEDEFYSDELLWIEEEFSRMRSTYFVTLREALGSPLGPELRLSMSSEEIEFIENYEVPEEDYMELVSNEWLIVDSYLKDYEENGIYGSDAANELLGGYYVELLKLRNEICRKDGYETYEEYQNEAYMRDFTREEILFFCNEVKKYSSVIYELISKLDTDRLRDPNLGSEFSGESSLSVLGRYVSDIDPDMKEVLDIMLERGLYDASFDLPDDGREKNSVSFTTYIYGYDVPFLFINPCGNYDDLMTAVHEFGHYFEMYINSDDSSLMDIKEIHSQGLEVLFTQFYDDIFGRSDGKMMEDYLLFRIVEALAEGCMMYEFEDFAYSLFSDGSDGNAPDDKDALYILNEKFGELMVEYGMATEEGLSEDPSTAYYWCAVPHLYSSPYYYISYATSGYAALYLWDLAQNEGYEAAEEKYIELIGYGSESYYKELLSKCRIDDPFTAGSVRDLLSDIAK